MNNFIKYKIVEKIIQTEDEAVLNEIKALLGLSEKDFWEDLPDEVKITISNAKAELNSGEGISHAQVAAEVKARYFKK
jgi:hypothetical protein